MTTVASQITSLTIVYSTVFFQATDQRKYQSSASLAFVRGIHRWPVNSPHKGPVTRKIFPFDDVIMWLEAEGKKRLIDNFQHGDMVLRRLLLRGQMPWPMWMKILFLIWVLMAPDLLKWQVLHASIYIISILIVVLRPSRCLLQDHISPIPRYWDNR